ncbi:MAG: NfeD family protein [Roseinatronobacter sp.]
MSLFSVPDWSIWGLIAVTLLIVEMLTAVYVALGFAISAALVALIVYLAPGLHIFVQALIWAGLGLAIWLALSRWSKSRNATRRDINDFDSVESLPESDRANRRR